MISITFKLQEDADFPPEVWASKNATNLATNNGCESFHAHFNAQFYHPKPNIFVFIDILKKEQSVTEVKLRSVANGEVEEPRRTTRDMISYTSRNIREFDEGTITRHHYVKRCSYRYKQ